MHSSECIASGNTARTHFVERSIREGAARCECVPWLQVGLNYRRNVGLGDRRWRAEHGTPWVYTMGERERGREQDRQQDIRCLSKWCFQPQCWYIQVAMYIHMLATYSCQ